MFSNTNNDERGLELRRAIASLHDDNIPSSLRAVDRIRSALRGVSDEDARKIINQQGPGSGRTAMHRILDILGEVDITATRGIATTTAMTLILYAPNIDIPAQDSVTAREQILRLTDPVLKFALLECSRRADDLKGASREDKFRVMTEISEQARQQRPSSEPVTQTRPAC